MSAVSVGIVVDFSEVNNVRDIISDMTGDQVPERLSLGLTGPNDLLNILGDCAFWLGLAHFCRPFADAFLSEAGKAAWKAIAGKKGEPKLNVSEENFEKLYMALKKTEYDLGIVGIGTKDDQPDYCSRDCTTKPRLETKEAFAADVVITSVLVNEIQITRDENADRYMLYEGYFRVTPDPMAVLIFRDKTDEQKIELGLTYEIRLNADGTVSRTISSP